MRCLLSKSRFSNAALFSPASVSADGSRFSKTAINPSLPEGEKSLISPGFRKATASLMAARSGGSLVGSLLWEAGSFFGSLSWEGGSFFGSLSCEGGLFFGSLPWEDGLFFDSLPCEADLFFGSLLPWGAGSVCGSLPSEDGSVCGSLAWEGGSFFGSLPSDLGFSSSISENGGSFSALAPAF